MPFTKKAISNKDIDGGLENKHLVNVLSLGVKNDGSTDCTDIIHEALAEGKALFFPNGIYLLEYLELNSYNVLIGENEHETILKPNISTKESFIYMCKGVCQHVRFENFGIHQSPNEGQIGINLEANFPDMGYQHGGLWDSTFRNIYLTFGDDTWNGIGMRLIGSGNNSMLPIQCNVFEKINIWANNLKNIEYIPLIVEGQVEQNLFNRCTFSGKDYSKTLIDLNNSAAIFRRRRKSDGTIEGDVGGASNTFLQCYFGNCPRCISFERSRGPMFINCYYENAQQLAYVATVSKLSIIDGVFAITSTEKYLIESDFTNHEVCLSDITKIADIKCRGVSMSNCKLSNKMYDEKACTSNEIKFSDPYSMIHFNHSESEITINTISSSDLLKSYNEFYLQIIAKSGKVINFSSSGGNIYNDLTLNISSKLCLIKVTKIPYLNKYRLEII